MSERGTLPGNARTLAIAVVVAKAMLCSASALAMQEPVLYSLSRDSATLYTLDPATGASLSSQVITLEGRSLRGGRGLAISPRTKQLFAVLAHRVDGSTPRLLATIDPVTGVAQEITDNRVGQTAALAFDNAGTLYGGQAANAGAGFENRLYVFDTLSGERTEFMQFANSEGGLALALNPKVSRIYHLSGTLVFGADITESVFETLNTAKKTRTDIPMSGDDVGHVRAMTYAPDGNFLVVATFDPFGPPETTGRFFRLTPDGVASELGAMDHVSKGIAFSPPVPPGARLDREGDGDSDVLLRNATNGSWRWFEISEFSVTASSGPKIFTSQMWNHQANADFDGDGDSDLLIRRNDGIWRIFEIQGGAVVGSAQVLLFQNLTWEFQAAADFDGDGDADILARKSDTGDWRIFTMQNRQVASTAGVALFPNALWELQGVDDYDGDGDGDVLLRRSDKGWWRIFQLQSGVLVGSAPAGPLFISSDWRYVTSGDMDKDGTAEIVLRRQSTGDWRVFKMQNRTVAGVGALNLFTNGLWAHAQTGDFDADGDQDLLLRQSQTSQWRMFNIENRRSVSNSAPTLWLNSNLQVQN